MLGWEGRMRESLFALWVIWAAIVGVSTGYTPLAVAACDPGFTQVNDDGFGDRNNLYAWSMEAFGGYLYVGTLNNIEGPQIWRWDGTTWEEVLRLDVATGNTGFRTMQVFKGWLYASTVNEEQGAELWRTQDGTTWEAVPAAMHGFGDPLNTSFRGMAIFKRQLYLGVQNQSGSGGQLWRTRDGARWRPVNQDGFGDTSNNSVHSLDVFGGMLYAGTGNDSQLQIFRSSDGRTFQQVVGTNAEVPAGFGIPKNQNAVQLFNYNGQMYVGTVDITLGFSVFRTTDGINYDKIASGGGGDPDNYFAWRFADYQDYLWLGIGNFNTAGGEGGSILRSQDGRKNWETLVGFDGTYFSYGFDQPLNWGIRSIKEFNNKLYFGTAQCWKAYCDPYTTGTQIWEWSGETCP
jgi:hypothetical protein